MMGIEDEEGKLDLNEYFQLVSYRVTDSQLSFKERRRIKRNFSSVSRNEKVEDLVGWK